jgi:putative hydrolase of the HAD superfamily
VHVVTEKGPEVLEEILDHHDLDPERTWMVGNSPRSDINPALTVGIGAVYIPYSVPWSYEETAIAQPDRVITLDSFAGLAPILLESETGE